MTVVVDVGNGSLKLASVIDGRVGPVQRVAVTPPPDPLDLAHWLAELAFGGPQDAGVALVSVVPAITELVREAAGVIGAQLFVVDAGSIPLRVALPHPGRVGADRVLGAWGGQLLHGAPLIVVDLGTATTVDAVDGSGAFVGGAILPGLELGLRALASGTALLPDVTLGPPADAIGRDTAAAIRSGVVLGHLGALREVTGKVAAELAPAGPRPTTVATGGVTLLPWMRDALLRSAGPGLPAIADVVDPELLLRSLGLLAARGAGVPS